MKNKIYLWLFLIIIYFFTFQAKSEDQFNFNVTEIQISENGNKFTGNKRGKITSNNGVSITANNFEYNKKLNILKASGDVEVNDEINKYLIYSEKLIYNKKKELITTEENSKVISLIDDVKITANRLEYNKKLNIFKASGDVEVNDEINKYLIYSEKLIYNKKKELITTEENSKVISLIDDVKITANRLEYFRISDIFNGYEKVFIEDKKKGYNLYSDYLNYSPKKGKLLSKGNSKLIDINDQTSVTSDNFEYDIINNIITAEKNVKLENIKKDYKISSSQIKYFRKNNKITTKGRTSAEIKSKYIINTENLTFLENSMEIFSNSKTLITDKNNAYNTSKFRYLITEEFLKAENVLIISNYKKPQKEKYYFSNAMIDLKNQDFISGKTEIKLRKDIFDNSKNDPRIKGVSSKKKGEITLVNKGVFTSCEKNNDCPPWSIEAAEIKHDQNKKEIYYKNAIMKVYNVPILYFPKFFHPDPTVNRRSGILKPSINDSNLLGSSLTIPYYKVLSDESDFTIAPTGYDTGTYMLQNEFRKINKNSDILINFGHNRDYKSVLQNKHKNTSYIFSKIDIDLNLQNFNSSNLNLKFEKVTNDTFLKIFDTNLNKNTTSLKPVDNSVSNSELSLNLKNDDYNFTTGFSSYENLQKNKSDRYQYILPYYDFNKEIVSDFIDGFFSFNSNGSNDLNNTNQLTTKLTNNLSYSSLDYFTKNGLKNNFNINFKNLNSMGKNMTDYKSSPQVELFSLFEANTSLPLKKKVNNNLSFLTPKLSLRFNPSDMKNHNNSDKTINVENIFSIDRLGLEDTFESGRSMTLGIDYKKEKVNQNSEETLETINNYFELKLATVFRDKEENFIPTKTTLNKKTSNVFGSISSNFNEYLNIKYNFALDNNIEDIEYNDINTTLTFNNFSTSFNYIKSINEMGDKDFIKNTTAYKFDNQNFLKFNTRRNRRINLTEFYDLVYEYKNDCLVAGIKYQKKYYEDKDLKPSEDLFFTVRFIPLTSFEQKID